MAMNERIYFFDTTLRDGEQTPGVNLNLQEKLEIARQLERLGVDMLEAGFPASSPGDFEAVSAVSKALKTTGVAGLARCVPGDVERCAQALQSAAHPRIHVFIATSPLHMQYKLRMEPDKVLERAVASVKMARNLCAEVEFSTEDGTRSEPEFLYRIVEAAIDAGARVINIPDTVGYAQPGEFAELIRGIRNAVPNIDKAILSVHVHDDLGLGVANSLSGLSAGARQVECTINGLGERAGNASLEAIAMALNTRKDLYPFTHGLDTTQLYRTSRMVASLTGVEVPPNTPIVGLNAFRHESGIHQHGMLANPLTYEIMTPESIGVPQSSMVLGKHSGRHAFSERLKELGFELSDAAIDAAFTRFKVLADRKKDITDLDIEALVEEKAYQAESIYRLEAFQLQSGNKISAMASVTLEHGGKLLEDAAVGDGPVDAVFQAINKIVGKEITLTSYGIKAVTEGTDALGEVTVRLLIDGQEQTGRGLSTDVIEAGARAYIAAINRALSV